MGFISTVLQLGALSGAAFYFAGRPGLRRAARFCGSAFGKSVARLRRSRRQIQTQLTAEETPEQRQAAIEMQRGWWELRMILNEWSMLRSLNPRLLQSGNFGFTDAEMLQAIGLTSDEIEKMKRTREDLKHRQLDLERQQLENPRMFPFAGFHGEQDDVKAFSELQNDSMASSSAGMDPVSKKVYVGMRDTDTRRSHTENSNNSTVSNHAPTGNLQKNDNTNLERLYNREISEFDASFTDSSGLDSDPSVVLVTNPDGSTVKRRMNIRVMSSSNDAGASAEGVLERLQQDRQAASQKFLSNLTTSKSTSTSAKTNPNHTSVNTGVSLWLQIAQDRLVAQHIEDENTNSKR